MRQDHYVRGYFKYHATALCRARDPYLDKVYSKYELVEVNSYVMVLLANNKEIVSDIAKSEIMIRYSLIMKDKINSDLKLKKVIGGISWSTDILNLSIKVYKHETTLDFGVSREYSIIK